MQLYQRRVRSSLIVPSISFANPIINCPVAFPNKLTALYLVGGYLTKSFPLNKPVSIRYSSTLHREVQQASSVLSSPSTLGSLA
jgi:hypothetical protein